MQKAVFDVCHRTEKTKVGRPFRKLLGCQSEEKGQVEAGLFPVDLFEHVSASYVKKQEFRSVSFKLLVSHCPTHGLCNPQRART